MTLQDRLDALERTNKELAEAVHFLKGRAAQREDELARLGQQRLKFDRQIAEREAYADDRAKRLETRLREAADAIQALARALGKN